MGIFYGVSTGPGDSELMTLKAVRILSECDVIVCPQTKSGASLALQIAQGAADLSEKCILPVEFPMTKDMEELRRNYDRITEILCGILETQNAAMLCLGDISLYATFPEIGRRVAEKGFRTEILPGVPSFCAAAARAGKSLASKNAPLQILPYGCVDFAERLRLPGGKVILKCGGHMPELTALLQEMQLLESAYAVENCGLETERLIPVLSVTAEQWGYFTVVCILSEDSGV